MSEANGFDKALVEMAEQPVRVRTVRAAVEARRALRALQQSRELFDDEVEMLDTVGTIMSTELVSLAPSERALATWINEGLMERALEHCARQQEMRIRRAYY